MPKLEDSVNEILGLEGKNKVIPENLEPQKGFKPPVPRKNGEVPLKVEKDINTDYDYSRESYYSIIEKGQEAIQGILDIAKEGQHPRAYEVVGQLLKTVSETNGKLLEIHKMKKDITREDAYQMVQKNAMKAWDQKIDFKSLLFKDKDISNILSKGEIEQLFDLNKVLKNIKKVFKRLEIE